MYNHTQLHKFLNVTLLLLLIVCRWSEDIFLLKSLHVCELSICKRFVYRGIVIEFEMILFKEENFNTFVEFRLVSLNFTHELCSREAAA